MVYLNLSFKRAATFFSLLLLFFAPKAKAVDIYALYTSACQRSIGIILNVDDRYIRILDQNGKIKEIERFEVIYLTSYPMDLIPINEIKNPELAPITRIKTLQGPNIVTLVEGWPIDFSEDRISFLTIEGGETVVQRSSIWQIEKVNSTQSISFKNSKQGKLRFAHPYAFQDCPISYIGQGDAVKRDVYPQLLMNDPLQLKKEFDRLAQGYRVMEDYENDQQFYPRPEIYKNITSLGVWHSFNSRYGESEVRSNNFSPILIDELSSGPFGYQQIFLTGAMPALYSIHEEIQTQAYYRMKADYFHFSAMVDPNLILVGNKYQWSEKDMDQGELRAVESGFMEFGFDYGSMSIEFVILGNVEVGARSQDRFAENSGNWTRTGLTYTASRWRLGAWLGQLGGEDLIRGNIVRLNFEFDFLKGESLKISYIQREIIYDGYEDPMLITAKLFKVNSHSNTFAVYYTHPLKQRYRVGGFFSIEDFATQYGNISTSEASFDKLFVKGGLMGSLSF